MMEKLRVYLQYLLPHHLLTEWMGKLAESRSPQLKNFLINSFIKRYHVDMSEAVSSNLDDYPTFNSFFIRQLKSGIRPIAEGESVIVSPADGTLAQFASINKNQLLQAKNYYFDLDRLLGDETLAQQFYNGSFATVYLAPHNYHRVHMPLSGKLIKTIYIPGKLFSVNRMTSEIIPHLYSRNERLVCVFETAAGKMAVILVGAMIVGSMQTVWMQKPIRAKQILTQDFANINLEKGNELGFFKIGSTVIILFEKNKVEWSSVLKHDSIIKVGQFLGNVRQ